LMASVIPFMSWTNHIALQKILALCTAVCKNLIVRGLGSSSFPSADKFLHSPPMAGILARPPGRAFFFRALVHCKAMRLAWPLPIQSLGLTAIPPMHYHQRLCEN